MKLKRRSVIIGMVTAAACFIAKEVKDRRKINDMEMEISNLNFNLREMAKVHNNFVDKVELHYEEINSRFDEVIDEIGAAYEHIGAFAEKME